jgi:hypothetical protein
MGPRQTGGKVHGSISSSRSAHLEDVPAVLGRSWAGFVGRRAERVSLFKFGKRPLMHLAEEQTPAKRALDSLDPNPSL